MNFAKFKNIAPYVSETTWQELLAMPKPIIIHGLWTPPDLNGLTWGALIQLQGCSRYIEVLGTSPLVVIGLSEAERDAEPIERLAGFANFVVKELERIGKLWETCQVPPSPQEQRAGVDRLSFGTFGLIDWFAKRQGISSHDDCLQVPWLTVWQCLQIDCERTKYERRLQKIYEKR